MQYKNEKTYSLLIDEIEDWSRLDVFMTPENLMSCGIMEYTGLAMCLGIDVLHKYQVFHSHSYRALDYPSLF